MFGVLCSITVLHDKLVPGKSDALCIISYGSFALMSLSLAKKFEIGFEIGCSTFFLQLFISQLSKTDLQLLPTALFFCLLIIVLRHYSESADQIGNGYQDASDDEVAPADQIRIDIDAEESSVDDMAIIQTEPESTLEAQPPALVWRRMKKIDIMGMAMALCVRRTISEVTSGIQNISNRVGHAIGRSLAQVAWWLPRRKKSHDSRVMGEVSEQSLSSTNRQQNYNQEEPSQDQNNEDEESRSPLPDRHRSSGMEEVSDQESTSDRGGEQNNDQAEEDPSSLAAESRDQNHVPSANNQVIFQMEGTHPVPESSRSSRRRRRGMPSGIQNISSHVGHTIGQLQQQAAAVHFSASRIQFRFFFF